MGEFRRVRVVTTFLLIWALAIFAENATLSILGPQRATPLDGVLFNFVLLIGVAWQVIFQGPTRYEAMERLRRKAGGEACTLDRVYLRFNIEQTVRVVIAFAIICGLSGRIGFVRQLGLAKSTLVVGVFLILAACRAYVLYIRVSEERFGTTSYEAKELLNFLQKLLEAPEARFHPPKPLRLLDEEGRQVVIMPHSAEPAL